MDNANGNTGHKWPRLRIDSLTDDIKSVYNNLKNAASQKQKDRVEEYKNEISRLLQEQLRSKGRMRYDEFISLQYNQWGNLTIRQPHLDHPPSTAKINWFVI